MGAVDTTYTFTATDTITSTKMNNIIDQTTITSDAIFGTTLEVASGKLKVRSQGITSNELSTDAVTSTKIAAGAVASGKLSTGGPTWGLAYTDTGFGVSGAYSVSLTPSRAGDGATGLYFGTQTGNNFNASIVRYGGANATFDFIQTGTAAIVFRSPSSAVAFEGPNGITLTNGGSSNANFPVPAGTAPIYGARAWVSFNGTGAIGANMAIRGSGNVSTVNKTSSGAYRVTFSTAMPDANYSAIVGDDANAQHKMGGVINQTATYVDIAYSQINTSTSRLDPTWGQVTIFR